MTRLAPAAGILAATLVVALGCLGQTPPAKEAAAKDSPANGAAVESPKSPSPKPPPPVDPAALRRYRVQVVAEYPHDPKAFTQGLIWHEGLLYESTGLYGSSTLRRVDPTTGRVEARVDLDSSLFGEGLERVGDLLYQITWQEGILQIFDLNLGLLDQKTYEGDGWGLAYDGERFVMTDGGPLLTFRDPKTFARTGEVAVRYGGGQIPQLNELEWAEGRLWANVLGQDMILEVDGQSGQVLGLVDARGLLSPQQRARANVMNGIAYDPDSQTFWITGKLWPSLFQVRFVPE